MKQNTHITIDYNYLGVGIDKFSYIRYIYSTYTSIILLDLSINIRISKEE